MQLEQVHKLESFSFLTYTNLQMHAFIQMHNKVVSLLSFVLEERSMAVKHDLRESPSLKHIPLKALNFKN